VKQSVERARVDVDRRDAVAERVIVYRVGSSPRTVPCPVACSVFAAMYASTSDTVIC
jgi:hypothetical protein